MRDYWYYGLRLRTDLTLDGFPRWPGEPDAPGIALRRGPVLERLEGATAPSARLQFNEAGHLLLRFSTLFRLLSLSESEFVIDVAPDAAWADVEGYLLSFVAGLVLHRRRALPLHASCVLVDGRAVVISGRSGRGKSTLATALTQAGCPLLSDDITVIRFDPAGAALAVPGSPHPRLKADSALANALDPRTLGESRAGDEKRIWRRDPFGFDPVPVAAVIRLDLAAPGEGPTMTRSQGPTAVLPLADLVYRFALGRRLGAAGQIAYSALLLAARAPIHRLARAQGLEALDRTVALILQTARGGVIRR